MQFMNQTQGNGINFGGNINPNQVPQDQKKTGPRGYADVTLENARVAGYITFFPNADTKHQSAKFTVMVNRDYTDRNGNVIPKATPVSVQAWGSLADVVCFFCGKGKQLNIKGELVNYDRVIQMNADGSAKTTRETTVTIQRLTLLSDPMSEIRENSKKNMTTILGQIAAEGTFHPNNIQLIVERLAANMFMQTDKQPMGGFNLQLAQQTGKHGKYGYVWTKDVGFWYKQLGFGEPGSDLGYEKKGQSGTIGFQGQPSLGQPMQPQTNIGAPMQPVQPMMMGQQPVQPMVAPQQPIMMAPQPVQPQVAPQQPALQPQVAQQAVTEQVPMTPEAVQEPVEVPKMEAEPTNEENPSDPFAG